MVLFVSVGVLKYVQKSVFCLMNFWLCHHFFRKIAMALGVFRTLSNIEDGTCHESW